jgi:hypothetical protein
VRGARYRRCSSPERSAHPPLYHWRGLLNGAPYQVGDPVRILAGRYQGRIGRVVHTWPENNIIDVELGGEEGKPVTDQFGTFEVARERAMP